MEVVMSIYTMHYFTYKSSIRAENRTRQTLREYSRSVDISVSVRLIFLDPSLKF